MDLTGMNYLPLCTLSDFQFKMVILSFFREDESKVLSNEALNLRKFNHSNAGDRAENLHFENIDPDLNFF